MLRQRPGPFPSPSPPQRPKRRRPPGRSPPGAPRTRWGPHSQLPPPGKSLLGKSRASRCRPPLRRHRPWRRPAASRSPNKLRRQLSQRRRRKTSSRHRSRPRGRPHPGRIAKRPRQRRHRRRSNPRRRLLQRNAARPMSNGADEVRRSSNTSDGNGSTAMITPGPKRYPLRIAERGPMRPRRSMARIRARWVPPHSRRPGTTATGHTLGGPIPGWEFREARGKRAVGLGCRRQRNGRPRATLWRRYRSKENST